MSANNRRTKLLFKILFGQLGVGLIVVVMALSILFYAQGYRFNYKNFKISRTGVLYVSTYPKNASISLNGKLETRKSPYSKNLLPARYVVSATLPGYSSWTKFVRIESELVSDYKNVVLFKTDPPVSTLSDARLIDRLNSPMDDLAQTKSSGLFNQGYEIWNNNTLVTRFSKPVYKAIWYTSDRDHIVFQQEDQIRVVELSGSNDTLLITLNSDKETNFFVNDKGEKLYFKDGDSYKVADIR